MARFLLCLLWSCVRFCCSVGNVWITGLIPIQDPRMTSGLIFPCFSSLSRIFLALLVDMCTFLLGIGFSFIIRDIYCYLKVGTIGLADQDMGGVFLRKD